MIKYLECADIHADERWIDVTMQCFDKIIETAKKEQVDFVTFPGDLHNKNFYLTKSYNMLREKIKELTNICPVCAVVGTPGHENEEMYKPLEDIGLVLLRPNKVYQFEPKAGFFDKPQDKLRPNTSVILFGVPELTIKNVLATNQQTAEQANSIVVKAFEKYIDTFVAPMRLKYENTPAIMLLHGEVSDSLQENSNDIITKKSNIVIHTEILERANLTRISLGHRHIPWESEKICAGYAGYCGIDDRPWNYLDFVPGMNLVEIDGGRTRDISRIPYGTPMRKKINHIIGNNIPPVDRNIAYWIVTNDPNMINDPNLHNIYHPWSRITHEEIRTETKRITEEQAANITTLTDLFKAIDPTVTKPVLKKVETIQEKIPDQTHKKVDVKLLGCEVAGCILFHEKIFKFDIAEFPDELTSLIGDNGAGKSSGASFCHPYPCIIGKDTNSGRMSAIKDFFDKPESYIKKWFTVNGQEHKHNIQIKGAHTQSPSVICSLMIDDKPILDKGTFEEMFSKCEELYGPFADYMLTSFYVQPLQSKNGTSGLMMANMTDIRDLVQSIAGVDRENEKRFALDQVKEINQNIIDTQNWIKGAEVFDIDPEPIQAEKEELTNKILSMQVKSSKIIKKGEMIKFKLDEANIIKSKSDYEKQRKENDKNKILELSKKIEINETRINKLKTNIKLRDNIEKAITEDKIAQQLKSEQDKKEREYENELSEYKQASTQIINKIENLENRSVTLADKIKILDKPCPQCGYIDPQNKETIIKLQTELSEIPAELKNNKLLRDTLVEPIKPESKEIINLLSESDRTRIQSELTEILSADKLIDEIKNNINIMQTEIDNLNKQEYNINIEIDDIVADLVTDRENLLEEYNGLKIEIVTAEEQLKNKDEILRSIDKTKNEINQKKESLKKLNDDLIDWKYIAGMLQPDKIPALELSLITDSIDKEATRNIEPYESGRYIFRTSTQDVGKKGLVDNFDIKIYDAEKGEKRSFLKYSVGEKAFFNDAYVKSLIRKRNERMHRKYSPIISDEADAPIQPHRISEYYEMQKKYFDGQQIKVIVISHAPEAHQYIENQINMKDLLI